jgi:hypothetical protein
MKEGDEKAVWQYNKISHINIENSFSAAKQTTDRAVRKTRMDSNASCYKDTTQLHELFAAWDTRMQPDAAHAKEIGNVYCIKLFQQYTL